MNRTNEVKIKASLEEAIAEWYEKTAEVVEMPITGRNIAALMADAAIAVLLAVGDAHDYLEESDMLKQD